MRKVIFGFMDSCMSAMHFTHFILMFNEFMMIKYCNGIMLFYREDDNNSNIINDIFLLSFIKFIMYINVKIFVYKKAINFIMKKLLYVFKLECQVMSINMWVIKG